MDLNVEKIRALKRQANALESIATSLSDLTKETRVSNTRLRAILYKLEGGTTEPLSEPKDENNE
jgi:hypothetical protein